MQHREALISRKSRAVGRLDLSCCTADALPALAYWPAHRLNRTRAEASELQKRGRVGMQASASAQSHPHICSDHDRWPLQSVAIIRIVESVVVAPTHAVVVAVPPAVIVVAAAVPAVLLAAAVSAEPTAPAVLPVIPSVAAAGAATAPPAEGRRIEGPAGTSRRSMVSKVPLPGSVAQARGTSQPRKKNAPARGRSHDGRELLRHGLAVRVQQSREPLRAVLSGRENILSCLEATSSCVCRPAELPRQERGVRRAPCLPRG
jgi:hypothetical protein